MQKGKIIVFEGIDGCGKDTQLDLFEKFLIQEKIISTTLREPGTTDVGLKLRQYLLHNENADLNPIQEAVLFNAARIALIIEEINPVLKKGEDILLNRYFYSTLAYQLKSHQIAKKNNESYVSPLSQKDGKTIEEIVSGTVRDHLPALTYIFDLPTKDALKRVGAKKDKFESRVFDYFDGVREAYLEIANELPNCVVLDATKKIPEIQEEVQQIYLEKFL